MILQKKITTNNMARDT
ncbi:unnamed protein product [Cuscuta epithymum]|uniref:Uncharacterized protein n=1 Tax=Cuscuta epithymum TaxID=186058 RepID=A0AAV0GJK7_9ASTE|nr:unnamed protein product [Cuscuta epithymum]